MLPFKIQEVVDTRLCYEKVRELRWSEGMVCPHCGSMSYRHQGHHPDSEYRHCYQCKSCQRHYDDLTNTIFQTQLHPLKTWILCLCLLRLHLPIVQIAQELGVSENDCRAMNHQLREGRIEIPAMEGKHPKSKVRYRHSKGNQPDQNSTDAHSSPCSG